ncbi:hypothetical protein [Nocardia niwae]|uniref:hypothetical protein n=1 Tax=Nocardia niwae TaxID=626084 RepID=UPI003409A82D
MESFDIYSHVEEDELGRDFFVDLYRPTPRQSLHRKPLAPELAFPEDLDDEVVTELHCTVTAIDDRGRIAAAAVMKHLGWITGQPCSFEIFRRSVVKIRRSSDGAKIRGSGFLHLPAAIRNKCRIYTGDRVLLAASLQADLLVVYPPHTLSAALGAHRPDLWGKAS